MEQFVKETMRPFHKPKEFRQVISSGLDDIWAMDIADMSEWAPENNGYKNILVVVDVFSRFAWCRPLKTKNANDVWSAFNSILQTGVKPSKIWVDKGSEFYNKVWATHLKSKGIEIYSTFGGEYKVSIAERFIRTIKNRLWFSFMTKGTHKWIDILQPIVDSYNKSIHSTIHMTPTEARTPQSENKLFALIKQPIRGKPLYKLGQWVRIARLKGKFEKGFHGNFSAEQFKIIGIKVNKPVMYELEDYDGKNIDGSFYESELSPVKNHDFYPIEKILERRRGKALVQYLGYKEPQWIQENQLV